MKRVIGWLSAALLSLALSGVGFADTDVGQHCWSFDQHVDNLRISASESSGNAFMYNVHARWRALELYQLLGAGEFAESLDPQYGWEMSMNFSHQTDYFGMNRTCYLHVYLDNDLHGPWSLECVGGGEPPYFANNGTMTYAPCTPDMPSQENEDVNARSSLPAAGD